ncbi:hypothetical protein SISSUDRAFT_993397 [Sistotremastrum suecicum HHB10207 ss-3]|uniref:Uncharacterized protein n=1 Tax=Sistotremastrum suecicum HHB10207 ss-3 TaxID=1314776 RepID=A0A165YD29_9AGAM|nr:hypothetical protein SISSUDRAFT_993397 [Sistotremastrum suecicum HHB10207 ss-3]
MDDQTETDPATVQSSDQPAIAFQTKPNKFGLFRRYRSKPMVIPDAPLTLEERSSPAIQQHTSERSIKKMIAKIIHPYPNLSAFMFGRWHWLGSGKKSLKDRDVLLEEVFKHKDFKLADVNSTNFKKIDAQLKDHQSTVIDDGKGWTTASVPIFVPNGHLPAQGPPGKRLFVDGLTYRPLVNVIKDVFASSEAAKTFHMEPYEEYWQNPKTPENPERVYGELYSSNSFVRAHEALMNSPREPNCDLPRAIAACMFWSDATHVAQFGQAKLWPCYLAFGNQSKYERCKPSANASHHFAYLPSLPDNIQEKIREIHAQLGKTGGIDPVLTHCRRELFQGCWDILLDDDFIEAYEHGIVIDCADGIKRRVYPRVFTYSADYPEKTQIATIRDMGRCHCPRCLIPLEDAPNMGTILDKRRQETMAREDSESRVTSVSTAREFVYEEGYAINSDRVENLLKAESLVPTTNAFSSKLRRFGFSLFVMLVVDFMHEFELGVWKALLTHLIRMLFTLGPSVIATLNERFRAVPTFGQSTIRKFASNVADMKKLAARDFEDILQCAIPCFEGLFPPEYNDAILKLLYLAAEWHSLAKLRMHTRSSLAQLSVTTTRFGAAMRSFVKNICPHIEAFETPAETAKRARAIAAQVAKGVQPKAKSGERKVKTLNLRTHKYHALGDHETTFQEVGTTDSISSQNGELEHRKAKQRVDRTNMNGFVLQVARLTTLHNRITSMADTLSNYGLGDRASQSSSRSTSVIPVDVQFHISSENRNAIPLVKIVQRNLEDRAYQDFVSRLRDHLWLRKTHTEFGDNIVVTPQQRDSIIIKGDRLYSHKTMRINYTTYDIRREQDTVNMKDKSFIMMLAHEESPTHPYWYAEVLGIYHAVVFEDMDLNPVTRHFLHVRWLGPESGWRGGTSHQRPDRVSYVDQSDPDAFGFLDPARVIRGAHLIPAFALGRTHELLRNSKHKHEKGDWLSFYVNRFVDRDMRMRFTDFSVGHAPGSSAPVQDSDRSHADITENTESLFNLNTSKFMRTMFETARH